MEEAETLHTSEHEETFEELENSLLILCTNEDEQTDNNPPNHCKNSELSYTSNLYSKINDIVNGFSNYNFAFPGYNEKVERQYRLGLLLHENRLKKDTKYPLCSIVKNDDISDYFSNYSKNNPEVNPENVKFPEHDANGNKFIESEEESSFNENSCTLSDISIDSLSDKDEDGNFEEDSNNLMENITDEALMDQSLIKKDVGSPCFISILSPTSGSLINSDDDELCDDENDTDITESDNSLMDNFENKVKSHPERINHPVIEPEYILMDTYENEELELYTSKNNTPESENKIIHKYETSMEFQDSSIGNNIKSSYVDLIFSPISDYSITSDEELNLEKNNISVTRLENKIIDSCQTQEIKSDPNTNNDNVNELENILMENNENESKSVTDKSIDVGESVKIIDNYENEETKLDFYRNNDDISESENKVMDNEVQSLPDKNNNLSEPENKIIDNYENKVKLHSDKNDDKCDSGNKSIDNYENEEIISDIDRNNEIIESKNKMISNYENNVKSSYLVKNNTEAEFEKKIKQNYENSEMLEIDQKDLLNSSVVKGDDIDLMDFIIVDSIDGFDKEEKFTMKAEEISKNDVFDGEKENIPLQSNVKQNTSEDESDYLIVTIDDIDTFSEQTESEVETKTKKTINKTSSKQNTSSKEKEVTKVPRKRPIRINRKWKNSDKNISEKPTPAKKIETKTNDSPNLSTFINAPKENTREKEIETKTEESSSSTNVNKAKYTIDDPLEIKDINDPEWDHMKSLTTEEERYGAVKNFWGSKIVPNPHKDLTRHSFRLKRLRKEGFKPDDIKRKRAATTEPEKLVDPKRQKMESFSCTDILDQKINIETKLYKRKLAEKECIYLKGLQKINNQVERERERLRAVYMQRFANSCQVRPLSYQFAYSADLELWKNYNERILREKEFVEKQSAKIRLANENKILVNTYHRTMNKLYQAREEVLEFNQFYCRLNNLNPTMLDEKRMREARKTEEMYEIFKQVYAA